MLDTKGGKKMREAKVTNVGKSGFLWTQCSLSAVRQTLCISLKLWFITSCVLRSACVQHWNLIWETVWIQVCAAGTRLKHTHRFERFTQRCCHTGLYHPKDAAVPHGWSRLCLLGGGLRSGAGTGGHGGGASHPDVWSPLWRTLAPGHQAAAAGSGRSPAHPHKHTHVGITVSHTALHHKSLFCLKGLYNLYSTLSIHTEGVLTTVHWW